MNAKTLVPLVVIILLIDAGNATFSQTGGAPLPPASTPLGQLEPVSSSTPMTPQMEADRAKIWNSPQMLRARAWAQEYCQRSAKITPEEAKDYMTELQRLTPKQMKLWLLKFNEEQEMMEQQQAQFEQSRQASVQQAMGIDRSIRQAYGRINSDETKAAQGEQQSIGEERRFAQQNAQNNQAERAADAQGVYGNYGYGYGGYAPYAPAQYHYHFHY